MRRRLFSFLLAAAMILGAFSVSGTALASENESTAAEEAVTEPVAEPESTAEPEDGEEAAYPVSIGGVQVTESNMNDVFGDGGSVKFSR